MSYDRSMYNKLNHIQEKALRIVYRDRESDYLTLLQKDNSVTVHQNNLQLLITEIFKTTNDLNPIFMKEIFKKKDSQYDLKINNRLQVPRHKTVAVYGKQSETYIGAFFGTRLWMRS